MHSTQRIMSNISMRVTAKHEETNAAQYFDSGFFYWWRTEAFVAFHTFFYKYLCRWRDRISKVCAHSKAQIKCILLVRAFSVGARKMNPIRPTRMRKIASPPSCTFSPAQKVRPSDETLVMIFSLTGIRNSWRVSIQG